MSPWLFALLNKGRELKTAGPFTSNTTWVAPLTTSNINTVSGKGAPGDTSYTKYTHIVTSRYKTGGGIDYVESDQDGWVNPDGSDFCDPAQPDSGIYYQYIQCFYHRTRTDTTTGASATAFGKTFPGGTGGAASTTTYTNIAVTPGGSYPIVVPSGGSITFTYWQ